MAENIVVDWQYNWADLGQHKVGWRILALTHDRARLVKDVPGGFRSYLFESQEVAVAAFTSMIQAGTDEPEGWVRALPSDRRRPGGDASKEYVRR